MLEINIRRWNRQRFPSSAKIYPPNGGWPHIFIPLFCENQREIFKTSMGLTVKSKQKPGVIVKFVDLKKITWQ